MTLLSNNIFIEELQRDTEEWGSAVSHRGVSVKPSGADRYTYLYTRAQRNPKRTVGWISSGPLGMKSNRAGHYTTTATHTKTGFQHLNRRHSVATDLLSRRISTKLHMHASLHVQRCDIDRFTGFTGSCATSSCLVISRQNFQRDCRSSKTKLSH